MPSNFSRRASRKKQTRLVLDSVEPSSSATNPSMTPARLRYQVSGSSVKTFDLSPQYQAVENEDDDVFASGKKYAVVIETPRKTEKSNNRIPFRPLISPVKSSQVNISDSDSDGKLFINTFLDIILVFKTNPSRVLGQRNALLKFYLPHSSLSRFR
jgi:hypothetical protein